MSNNPIQNSFNVNNLLHIKKEWLLNSFFFLFIALVLANRLFLFFTVNELCIDNDQVVMWAGAKDFSEGEFHVPLFYGQDYNTMLEALVAAPLVWLAVPIYYAVPIATHALFLFPFLFTAIYLFKKQHKAQAILVLTILLCLPVGYDIITAIPRGFVTGLFFCSFFIITILNPTNYKWIAINTFLSGLAYIANPNSVLVSAPLLCFVFLSNYKLKTYYYATMLGALPALLILLIIKSFYANYKNPLVYNLSNTFGFSYFKDALLNLDKRFMHVSFFNEGWSFLLLLILLALGLCIYLKNKKAFVAFIIFITIIVLSLFTSKATDGAEWAFYSYSRLYLGMPFFIALFSSLLNIRKSIFPLVITVLAFFIIKISGFKEAVNYHSDEKKWSHLNLISLADLKNHLNTYLKFSNENNAPFFVVGAVWRDDFTNYAGPVVCPNFPQTFKPSYERQSWLITENKHKVVPRFLILMRESKNIEALNNPRIFKLDDYGLFLVTDNTLTLQDFSNKINCPIYEGD